MLLGWVWHLHAASASNGRVWHIAIASNLVRSIHNDLQRHGICAINLQTLTYYKRCTALDHVSSVWRIMNAHHSLAQVIGKDTSHLPNDSGLPNTRPPKE